MILSIHSLKPMPRIAKVPRPPHFAVGSVSSQCTGHEFEELAALASPVDIQTWKCFKGNISVLEKVGSHVKGNILMHAYASLAEPLHLQERITDGKLHRTLPRPVTEHRERERERVLCPEILQVPVFLLHKLHCEHLHVQASSTFQRSAPKSYCEYLAHLAP